MVQSCALVSLSLGAVSAFTCLNRRCLFLIPDLTRLAVRLAHVRFVAMEAIQLVPCDAHEVEDCFNLDCRLLSSDGITVLLPSAVEAGMKKIHEREMTWIAK